MKKIYKALFEVQKSVGVIYKTQTGQVGKGSYKYADIGTVLETLAPHFQKNNILLSQAVVDLKNTVVVTKQIMTKSGSGPITSTSETKTVEVITPTSETKTVEVITPTSETKTVEVITPTPEDTSKKTVAKAEDKTNNVILQNPQSTITSMSKQTSSDNGEGPSSSSSTQIVIPQMGIHTVLRYVGDDAEEDDFIESITPIPSETESRMSVYQSYGSGITYFRRYSLASLLGLVTDEDNDGNTQKSQAVHQKSKITESVMKRIETRAKSGNITYDELIAAVKENFDATKEDEEQIKSFFA